MALHTSGLSIAALALRGLLAENIEGITESQIMLGPPAKINESDLNTSPRINIFCYNVLYDVPVTTMLGQENPVVTQQFLLTPIGCAQPEIHLTAGEADLRILGELMRVLYQNPVLAIYSDDAPVCKTNLSMRNVSLEEQGKIWGAQKDAIFRPSIACDLLTVPIVPTPTPLDVLPFTSITIKHNPFREDTEEVIKDQVKSSSTPTIIIDHEGEARD